MSDLPKGWANVPVTEFAALHDGRRVPLNAKQRESVKGKYPYYGANGLVDHINDYIFDGHYTLLAEDGGHFDDPKRGVAYEASGRFWVNNHAHILEPLGGISNRFLTHALNNLNWMPFVSGSTRLKLTQGGLQRAPLLLPPLLEQRRIVAKIDSVSAKSRRARDHLDHIPRLVEKYKQAILAAAFRGELTREWRSNHREPLKVSPRAQKEIQRKFAATPSVFEPPYVLPKDWEWLRLPELGGLDRGKSRHRPRNDPRLFGGPYPFIQTGEVRSADRFLTSYTETYSEFGLAQSRLWPAGTVCITIAANIAETALLSFDACFPDSVVGFLPDPDKADASYIEFFLRTARAELEAFAPATAQKNINLDTLGDVRVPTAPLLEQQEIIRVIEKSFVWIDRLASEATSARKLIDHLDQAILAKAFRGELVPQDPNDEPASVLLERIRAERAAAAPAKGNGKGRRKASSLS